MDGGIESGLELKPLTGLEVGPQPNDKYCIGVGGSNHPVPNQPDQSDQSHAKSGGRSRAVWMLAVILVIFLAIASGVGLGEALKFKHRSNSSSSAPTASTKANDAPVTTTKSGNITTIIPTPPTVPSSICPAANGSTYIATNKPLPTIPPQLTLQITEASLSFEILCNTNLFETGVMDLQLITNISTLNDCLDACALYNFQMKVGNFPTYGCTGIAWGKGWLKSADVQWPVCWLKNNITLATHNNTAWLPGFDGAVFLGF